MTNDQLQQQQVDLQTQQDDLRPVRQFLSLVSGMAGDQTYVGTDANATGVTGQFITQGPGGVAIEGQPVITAGTGTNAPAVGIPPVVIIGLCLLAYLALK